MSKPSTRARAAGGQQQAQQHAHGGGLAAAVRAQVAHHLAALDRERDLIDGGEVAELLDQVVDFDGGLGHSATAGSLLRHSARAGIRLEQGDEHVFQGGRRGRSRSTPRRPAPAPAGRRCQRPGLAAHAQVKAVAEGDRRLPRRGRRWRHARAVSLGWAASSSTRPPSEAVSWRGVPSHQQAAALHEAHAVAAGGLVHVGRADDHRRAVGQHADDELPEVLARHRVHAAGGLVEQQHFRLGG